ncbi:MAG TPA: aminotransferase class V-fold PLP-dependent enzyme [Bryobacteraceae bacterium]|jgi:cysteine desulfurase/selenocysteine lyase|nr:aminotransferase class V-fold PLP-dependent enzyme [Bryobacteraceae bacterium]
MTDWNAIRAEFPALQKWTYLNSATFGQMPRRAVQACAKHFAHRDEQACSDFLDWFDDADRLRGSIAKLIQASAADIAFARNTAAALGLAVNGIGWRAGDNVVTLADEFPNYLYLPALVERRGVEFRQVLWPRWFDAIDHRTRLVAISEVNYASGFRPPLLEISRFLRERDVIFFVDGTQSVGALRFDVRAIDPDMLAVHGYKWMCAPMGAAFFYIAPRFRDKLPPAEIGWRSHRGWREVDDLHHGQPEMVEAAEKYEAGGLPFALLYAMEAAVDLMLEIGVDEIEQRVLELACSARARLRNLGAEVSETGSQIVAAKFSGIDPSVLARELKSRRILVAARHGFLRVSPHFYNNSDDLDRLESELRKLI